MGLVRFQDSPRQGASTFDSFAVESAFALLLPKVTKRKIKNRRSYALNSSNQDRIVPGCDIGLSADMPLCSLFPRSAHGIYQ